MTTNDTLRPEVARLDREIAANRAAWTIAGAGIARWWRWVGDTWSDGLEFYVARDLELQAARRRATNGRTA